MVEFIFVTAVITLSLTIIIRSVKMFSTQALLLLFIFFIPGSLDSMLVSLLLSVLQFILIGYTIY